MSEFLIQFDLSPFKKLDQLALLATQDYNLGNTGNWFTEFRGGLYGFYARVFGVQRHYYEVHAWLPRVRCPTETEYHLTSILFQMDSALECVIFALNAFGWLLAPTDFRDVNDAKTLRRISPFDVLGNATRTPPLSPIAGYQTVFPTMQRAWQNEALLIDRIRELHDVSKHRKAIYQGGLSRLDAPVGFFEAIGLLDDGSGRSEYWPMAELILADDPKRPTTDKSRSAITQCELLEDLVPLFAALIKTTGSTALADLLAKVPLREKELRK